MEQRPIITSQYVRRVKIIALRNGRWFKLHPDEQVKQSNSYTYL